MKKFYPSTLCALFISFLSVSYLSSSAQTGGTYTAVLPGNWHNPDPMSHGIWAGSEPPMNCSNCLIILNVSPNQTVTLNAHVVLSNNSQLIIGGGTNGTTLFIPNSHSTDTTHSNSINL